MKKIKKIIISGALLVSTMTLLNAVVEAEKSRERATHENKIISVAEHKHTYGCGGFWDPHCHDEKKD